MTKIMVVDDDEEFTNLYRAYLNLVGFEVVAETQSSKAMALADETTPDLFILDLMMPAPDGFKLCRMLRAAPKFKTTPIIIITALSDMDSKMVAIGAGANDYLTKPFRIEDLKGRIDSLVRR